IRRDIQREPVPRDPLLHVHADAGDLAAAPAGPDAGVAGPTLGRDVELGERVDQGLLERAQVPVEVAAIAAQVQDGIADGLPRTAQALAAPPSTKLASPQTARPATPSRWSIGQAMNPSSSAPTHARTAITPRCQRLSSQRLRRQPNVALTARPASVPARTGSAALSW